MCSPEWSQYTAQRYKDSARKEPGPRNRLGAAIDAGTPTKRGGAQATLAKAEALREDQRLKFEKDTKRLGAVAE